MIKDLGRGGIRLQRPQTSGAVRPAFRPSLARLAPSPSAARSSQPSQPSSQPSQPSSQPSSSQPSSKPSLSKPVSSRLSILSRADEEQLSSDEEEDQNENTASFSMQTLTEAPVENENEEVIQRVYEPSAEDRHVIKDKEQEKENIKDTLNLQTEIHANNKSQPTAQQKKPQTSVPLKKAANKISSSDNDKAQDLSEEPETEIEQNATQTKNKTSDAQLQSTKESEESAKSGSKRTKKSNQELAAKEKPKVAKKGSSKKQVEIAEEKEERQAADAQKQTIGEAERNTKSHKKVSKSRSKRKASVVSEAEENEGAEKETKKESEEEKKKSKRKPKTQADKVIKKAANRKSKKHSDEEKNSEDDVSDWEEEEKAKKSKASKRKKKDIESEDDEEVDSEKEEAKEKRKKRTVAAKKKKQSKSDEADETEEKSKAAPKKRATSILPMAQRTLKSIIEDHYNGQVSASSIREKVRKGMQPADVEEVDDEAVAKIEENRMALSRQPLVAAPRVKLVDGKLVIEQESLRIQADVADTSGYVRVDETHRRITAGTYSKRISALKWTEAETDVFFRAIMMYGTDFTFVSQLLPKRTRKEVRNKFKREQKANPEKMDAAMISSTPMDFEEFEAALERVKTESALKKEKKTVRDDEDVSEIKGKEEDEEDDDDDCVASEVTSRTLRPLEVHSDDEDFVSAKTEGTADARAKGKKGASKGSTFVPKHDDDLDNSVLGDNSDEGVELAVDELEADLDWAAQDDDALEF